MKGNKVYRAALPCGPRIHEDEIRTPTLPPLGVLMGAWPSPSPTYPGRPPTCQPFATVRNQPTYSRVYTTSSMYVHSIAAVAHPRISNPPMYMRNYVIPSGTTQWSSRYWIPVGEKGNDEGTDEIM